MATTINITRSAYNPAKEANMKYMGNQQLSRGLPDLKQNGFALATAMLLLLVVTLIGSHSLRSSMLNEQMTRSAHQREVALEAAEIALLAGEADVENFGYQIATRVFYNSGADDNDRQNNNDGDDCDVVINNQGGVCIPVRYTNSFVPSNADYEHWVDVDGDPKSKNVWSTGDLHRKVDDNVKNRLGVNEAPRYIIEFMGYIVPLDQNTGNRQQSGCYDATTQTLPADAQVWPFCDEDDLLFRITALGTSGNNDETRVMLQSTYILPGT